MFISRIPLSVVAHSGAATGCRGGGTRVQETPVDHNMELQSVEIEPLRAFGALLKRTFMVKPSKVPRPDP